MFKIDIDGVEYEAKVTFLTAQLYEMEFRSDMLQDLLGVQTAETVMDYDVSEGEAKLVKIDFTRISWSAVMKVLWASLKTANQSTPSYMDWMKKTSGVNLWVAQDLLGDEVSDCFFRAGTAKEDAQEAEE